MSSTGDHHDGSCLCGGVRFTVAGPLPAPDICHCTICRKHSGHCFASCDVPRGALTMVSDDTLAWYASSAAVRRGFCARCGSSLFWDPPARDWIAVAMGAFDGPTGTVAHAHIFTGEKGDYYEIGDDLPQHR